MASLGVPKSELRRINRAITKQGFKALSVKRRRGEASIIHMTDKTGIVYKSCYATRLDFKRIIAAQNQFRAHYYLWVKDDN